MKSVVFLLPCSATLPVGGFKVIYEYANRLVQDGLQVCIVYAAQLFPEEFSLVYRLRRRHYYWHLKQTKEYLPDKWFVLDERIQQKWVYSLEQKNIPMADYYIATSWETAEYLMNYQGIDSWRKFYFIQHYEKWSCNDERRLIATWKAPLHKVVIAPWLENIAHEIGEVVDVVENGFDFDCFYISKEIQGRQHDRIVMLYHELMWKGTQDAFKALDIVKRQYSNLTVNLFGVFPRPENLPDWYIYYQMPSKEILNRIYNEASIYIGASHSEGWGLTVGEAMQCGCAVACTDNGGYAVLAHHEETALVSAVKNVDALAMNVVRLIEDRELRFRLAVAGNQYVQGFTWERAYSKFKNILIKC